MKKFEYFTAVNLDLTQLNELGSLGWELIYVKETKVLHDVDLDDENTISIDIKKDKFIFKREI